MTKPRPDGYHSVTPSFTFKDCKKAIAFYEKAFGAKQITHMPNLDGRGTMHAVIQIGDSMLMMGDEMPGMSCKSAETLGHSPISLYVYVPDVDKAFEQAVKAGAKVAMPLMDMFWGDRTANLEDPFGYSWMLATQKRTPSREEIEAGAKTFFAQMSKK